MTTRSAPAPRVTRDPPPDDEVLVLRRPRTVLGQDDARLHRQALERSGHELVLVLDGDDQVDEAVIDQMRLALTGRSELAAVLAGATAPTHGRPWRAVLCGDAVVQGRSLLAVSAFHQTLLVPSLSGVLARRRDLLDAVREAPQLGDFDAGVLFGLVAGRDVLHLADRRTADGVAVGSPDGRVQWASLRAAFAPAGMLPVAMEQLVVGSAGVPPWWDVSQLRRLRELADVEPSDLAASLDALVAAAAGDHTLLLGAVRVLLGRDEVGRAVQLLTPLADVPVSHGESMLLLARVAHDHGDPDLSRQLLASARAVAPLDPRVTEHDLAMRPATPRPPVGRGPRELLQGPEVVADPAGRPGLTSVVVVTFNSAETVLDTIRPLVGCPDVEVVVLDNASRDDTVALLTAQEATWPNVRLVQSPENLGFAAGCNAGIRQTSGDAVLLLNPDAVITPQQVRRLRAGLERDDRLEAVGPLSDHVAGLQDLRHHLGEDDHLVIAGHAAAGDVDAMRDWFARERADHLVEVPLLIGLCLLVRRRTLHRLGGLDDRLFFENDDLDLSWRITETGGHLAIVGDTFVPHVGHVSARSLGSDRRARLTQASRRVLHDKLSAYYGTEVPCGRALWGIPWTVD